MCCKSYIIDIKRKLVCIKFSLSGWYRGRGDGVTAQTNAVWAEPYKNRIPPENRWNIVPNFWETFPENLRLPRNLTSLPCVSRKISQASRSLAKSSDSQKNFYFFIFLPKQPFLELMPPLADKRNFFTVEFYLTITHRT